MSASGFPESPSDFPSEMMTNEVLYGLISAVAIELGISPWKMAKLSGEVILAMNKMKLDNENAEPPEFPEEEL